MHSQFHLRLVTLLMLIVTSSPQCWLHFIFNIQVVYVHMLLNSQFTKPCIWLEYDLVMFCFIRGKLIFITNSRRYLSVSSLLQILEVPNPTTLWFPQHLWSTISRFNRLCIFLVQFECSLWHSDSLLFFLLSFPNLIAFSKFYKHIFCSKRKHIYLILVSKSEQQIAFPAWAAWENAQFTFQNPTTISKWFHPF